METQTMRQTGSIKMHIQAQKILTIQPTTKKIIKINYKLPEAKATIHWKKPINNKVKLKNNWRTYIILTWTPLSIKIRLNMKKVLLLWQLIHNWMSIVLKVLKLPSNLMANKLTVKLISIIQVQNLNRYLSETLLISVLTISPNIRQAVYPKITKHKISRLSVKF